MSSWSRSCATLVVALLLAMVSPNRLAARADVPTPPASRAIDAASAEAALAHRAIPSRGARFTGLRAPENAR